MLVRNTHKDPINVSAQNDKGIPSYKRPKIHDTTEEQFAGCSHSTPNDKYRKTYPAIPKKS